MPHSKPQDNRLWSRPVAFETETKPETFQTEAETRKMGLETSLETETKSRDSITE